MSGEWRVGVAAAAVLLGIGGAVWAALTAAPDIIGAHSWSDAPSVVWCAPLAVVCVVIAALGSRTLARADEWLDDVPAKSYLPAVARFAGVALGALGAAVTTDRLGWRIAAGALALAAIVFTVLRARMLRSEILDTRVERARIDALLTHGRRVRAEVVEAEFTQVWVGAMMLFEVIAEYTSRSGSHQVRERLLTGIDDAPAAGGTVLLWVAADGSAPTDVVMQTDPDSIRHPDPSALLPVVEPPLARRRWLA
ncbi:hypothetical protein [Microbacterium sp. GXF0217]